MVPVAGRKFDRVWIYYPRGVRTGGPEALHQLCDSLREQGQEAFLVPWPTTLTSERVPAYRTYDAPEVVRPKVGELDAVVLPESSSANTHQWRNATVFRWWLSVDNSYPFRAEMTWRSRKVTLTRRRSPTLVAAVAAEFALRPALLHRFQSHKHLAQSHYAAEFVRTRFREVAAPVSDYVTVPLCDEPNVVKHRPVVSYNAAKSGRQIERVRLQTSQDIEWLPIGGMQPGEVEAALSRSHVHLDLGRQPGKDRMPREAALSGAITLIAGTGAGADRVDFPLPEEHRIPLIGSLATNAAEVLANVLDDLPGHHLRQRDFRLRLAQERTVFNAEVQRAFLGGEVAS